MPKLEIRTGRAVVGVAESLGGGTGTYSGVGRPRNQCPRKVVEGGAPAFIGLGTNV